MLIIVHPNPGELPVQEDSGAAHHIPVLLPIKEEVYPVSDRLPLLLLTALTALVLAITAAAGAGYLSRRDGASYPAAITRAAAAFAAMLTVTAALITAMAALVG